MAKENPYKKEQEVLDIDSINLESVAEKQLKELKDKVAEQYSKARKNRIEVTKKFIDVYMNLGSKRIELKEKVKNGTLTPEQAIREIKSFVNDDKELLKEN